MAEHPTDAVPHIREHRSLLADVEKRALIWIAARLPSWLNSDHLSLLGLAAMAGAGASFAAIGSVPGAAWGVVLSLFINWFGDSLDGTVARVRNQQRPRYGFYVDHVIDIAGTSFLFGGLTFSGLIDPVLAVGLLAAYLLVSAEVYLSTHVCGIFRMSFIGCGPTELRILLAVGAIRVASNPWISIGSFGRVRLLDVGAAVALAGLIVAFAVSAARNLRMLYRLEPMPAGRTIAASQALEP